MVKKQEEKKEETEKNNEDFSLVETVKERGIGLQMPEGNVIDLSDVPAGQAVWMEWATRTLNDIKKNLVG